MNEEELVTVKHRPGWYVQLLAFSQLASLLVIIFEGFWAIYHTVKPSPLFFIALATLIALCLTEVIKAKGSFKR